MNFNFLCCHCQPTQNPENCTVGATMVTVSLATGAPTRNTERNLIILDNEMEPLALLASFYISFNLSSLFDHSNQCYLCPPRV